MIQRGGMQSGERSATTLGREISVGILPCRQSNPDGTHPRVAQPLQMNRPLPPYGYVRVRTSIWVARESAVWA